MRRRWGQTGLRATRLHVTMEGTATAGRIRENTGVDEEMNHIRGALMLLAAGVAFWRGWKIHTGHTALLAYSLGSLALGLAIWHFTRKADRPHV
jgi:hypothetical protein